MIDRKIQQLEEEIVHLKRLKEENKTLEKSLNCGCYIADGMMQDGCDTARKLSKEWVRLNRIGDRNGRIEVGRERRSHFGLDV